MTKTKIYLSDILPRLEQAIRFPCGESGMAVLLYGWRVKMHLPERFFEQRNWLTPEELKSFSEYAGYDLTS